MKDFRTVTLADQVFERLESDIIQGVYPRGEVLTELRLVEQLNVSRTPIREALRRLEQEHLIADTGKGTAFPKWIRFYATWILPLIVLYIFAAGYYAMFFK